MSTLTNKLARTRALKTGQGLQYLLNKGYEIMGNPIYIHDIDHRFIAHTENIASDDVLWNELFTCGFYGKETLELLKTEYYLDAVASADTVIFLTSRKFKYGRLLGKIQNKERITVLCANAVACRKPFAEDDSAVFEALCRKITGEVNKDDFYLNYGVRHQEKVIAELIGGRVKDKRLYSQSVADIYLGLQNYIYVAVADIGKPAGEVKLEQLKKMFKRQQPAFKYAVYHDGVVIIGSAGQAELDAERDLRRLKKLLVEDNIRIGVSSCFENLFEMHKYYREALAALGSGVKRARGRVFLHSRLPATEK